MTDGNEPPKAQIKHEWIKNQVDGFSETHQKLVDLQENINDGIDKQECISILEKFKDKEKIFGGRENSDQHVAVAVVGVQAALHHLGYKSVGKIDGFFGKNTKAAVKNFQQQWNDENQSDHIDEDGIPGPQTIGRLLKELQKAEKQAEAATQAGASEASTANEASYLGESDAGFSDQLEGNSDPYANEDDNNQSEDDGVAFSVRLATTGRPLLTVNTLGGITISEQASSQALAPIQQADMQRAKQAAENCVASGQCTKEEGAQGPKYLRNDGVPLLATITGGIMFGHPSLLDGTYDQPTETQTSDKDDELSAAKTNILTIDNGKLALRIVPAAEQEKTKADAKSLVSSGEYTVSTTDEDYTQYNKDGTPIMVVTDTGLIYRVEINEAAEIEQKIASAVDAARSITDKKELDSLLDAPFFISDFLKNLEFTSRGIMSTVIFGISRRMDWHALDTKGKEQVVSQLNKWWKAEKD